MGRSESGSTVTSIDGKNWWFDSASGAMIFNEGGDDLNVTQVMNAFNKQHPEVAELVRWSYTSHGEGGRRRQGGLFERDRYVTPHSVFEQFDVAQSAVENDDVVGGVLETLESLAFSRMGFEVEDPDEEDIWNQIAADLDLDARIREIWRELFTVSQCYIAVYWGKKTYKVRGKSQKGVSRKKTFTSLTVPLGLTTLDPKKVIPIGNFMFNQEKLVYVADVWEQGVFDKVLSGKIEDPVVQQMILQPYEPTSNEIAWMQELGVPKQSAYLYLLNPQNVFRHTATRPQYKHMASVRLKNVFDLLDLKAQLKEMDRAHLIGGTNYILLVKKGTDQRPATAPELNSLSAQVRMQARVPVIVGDHRLSIEIVTPKMDLVLNQMKYDTIDARIQSRLLQMFVNTGHISRGDDHGKLARVIAMGIESRRRMIRRSLEKNLIRVTLERNPSLTDMPTLAFYPKRIALDFDANLAAYLLDLRDRGEISRGTLLSEFDYSQDDEAIKIEREHELYDDIFHTIVPFTGGQAPGQPGAAQNPQGNQANSPRTAGRNRDGNRTTGRAASGGKATGTAGDKQGKDKEQQR